MKIFNFILIIIILSRTISNSQEIEWQKTIGGSDVDYLNSIKQTSDEGYLLGGSSSSNISGDKTEDSKGFQDFWIVKTDSACNIQWQKTIGGSYDDRLTSFQQTRDGGYILGGYSYSNISGDKTENNIGGEDGWIVKTDANGNIQWQNTIGGSGSDEFQSIQQTSDGGYILGGSSDSNISGDKTENSNGFTDYWIVKTDSSGNIQWQNTIGGNQYDYLYSIQQTSDGGYILGGMSESYSSGDKTENCNGMMDYWIVKTDGLGNLQWQNTIGGANMDEIISIQQTSDGGYILGGNSDSNISGDKTESSNGLYDYWVVKTDSTGNIQWQNTIGGNSNDFLFSIQQSIDGGFILGGYSDSNISGDKKENSNGVQDFWIVKTDFSGNIQWQNTIGGSNNDYLYSVQQTYDGNFILGGYSNSNISFDKTENCKGDLDYWIAKVSGKINLITGKLYADLNSNYLQDSGEHAIVNHPLKELITGRLSYSQSGGIYYLSTIDSGNFIASPFLLPHFTAVPLQHNVNFTGILQTDSLNDFAFQPMGIVNDLQIRITPVSPFRPGFLGHYNIHYKNIGTTSLTGTVVLYPDSNLTYSSSSIFPTGIYPDSIVWQTSVLAPFEEGDILVTVDVNSGITIGTMVNSKAGIYPLSGDANMSNNLASWELNVTGSVDPNDILVSRTRVETAELVSPPYLEYIIRFQNTGTDTAFTVKINNPLPVNSDLSTFEFLESSRPVQLNYLNPEKIIWFQFDNILLADSNTNEPMSHGYVRYRIKPLMSLSAGDSVKNTAYIYFDFNAPVVTNTAITEIVFPVTIPELKNDFDFLVFPNPAKDKLNLDFISSGITEVQIFNLVGQLVYSNDNPVLTHFQMDVSKFKNGAYIIKLVSGLGTTFRKFEIIN